MGKPHCTVSPKRIRAHATRQLALCTSELKHGLYSNVIAALDNLEKYCSDDGERVFHLGIIRGMIIQCATAEAVKPVRGAV
jgi:hypothetical protein